MERVFCTPSGVLSKYKKQNPGKELPQDKKWYRRINRWRPAVGGEHAWHTIWLIPAGVDPTSKGTLPAPCAAVAISLEV